VRKISSRLYHVSVHSLTERLLDHIRRQELLKAGQRVGVAVSGGIDSVALSRLLLELRGELGIVLSVAHFNHKLRGAESDSDEEFVASLARAHGLDFVSESDDVAGHAASEGVSLETAARELRYGFFRHLLKSQDTPGVQAHTEQSSLDPRAGSAAPSRSDQQYIGGKLDVMVTGHTLDDQAETVLMRLIRGTGPTGLGAIHPRIAVEDDTGDVCGEIVRPLLAFRRGELEQYLKGIGQSWREDSTNADDSFTRNRVRRLLIPLLEKEFNPSIAENLAELAEIARGEEDYWQNEVAGWMGTGVHWSQPEWALARPNAGLVQIAANIPTSRAENAREMGHPTNDHLQARIDKARWLVMNASVDLLWFLGEPAAVQRRVIKAMGREAGIPLEFKHVEEILRFASEPGKSGKELSLPFGWKVSRRSEELLFVTPDLRDPLTLRDYEYPLTIPGEATVAEAGFVIQVQCIPADEAGGYNPDQLLNADSLPRLLRVRNWRAGDRFWPAHTKSPKKIKELLQELHVEPPTRGLWPVVAGQDDIVWMRGYPAAAKYRFKGNGPAILITERPFAKNS
jgi:tRNA(Ile)-lysidine synthase